jgi:hypothetical protein
LVSGSIRETLASWLFTTQTDPAPTATAIGASPTGIVVVELDPVSMRWTTSSPSVATQTTPSAKAMPRGDRPTDTVLTTLSVRGFMRTTAFSTLFATQTAPAPTVTALGPEPAKPDDVSDPVMRATVPMPEANHAEPSPTAIVPAFERGARASYVRETTFTEGSI